ncbi:MAG: hypothetical protein BRC48_04160 [Cyanobacteria bacterium QS_9_48_30]|nr:MAG: hypothetical protein BRC48_04160 [Cyanobacteria bacterium QS_9_48_30]
MDYGKRSKATMRENNRNCSKYNVFITNKIPQKLEKCNPRQRIFPLSWKEAYFRMNMSNQLEGYVCPKCKEIFCGNKGFKQLKCDHIYPFSKGGLTVWENLQLLCKKCNREKSSNINCF